MRELCFVYLQNLAHSGCMVAAAWKNEPYLLKPSPTMSQPIKAKQTGWGTPFSILSPGLWAPRLTYKSIFH